MNKESESSSCELPPRYRSSIRILDKHPDKDFAFPIMAAAFKGSRLVSYDFNKPKTEPLMKKTAVDNGICSMYDEYSKGYVSQCGHAEVRCVKHCPTDFDTMLVARKTKDGNLAMARPCNICKAVLRGAGVKRIFYSTPKGFKQMEML